MKIERNNYGDKEVLIESTISVSLTDKNGHNYTIKENRDRDGFEILCNDGVVNIRPECSNALYINASK